MATYTNESLQSINKKDMITIVLSLQNKLNQANNKVLEETLKLNDNFSKLESELSVTKQVLGQVNAWASQWKMTFNPDPNKQAQEFIFSRKIKKTSHPPLNFNNNSVKQVQFQKHLGVYLDDKLDFREHLQNIFKKAKRTISLLGKLHNSLPKAHTFFIRPRLNYRDILYDQTFNNSFHEKLESIQYNAALAITGAIRGSSIEILYQELGFESLQQRW